jgi:Uma2 family endonuclease
MATQFEAPQITIEEFIRLYDEQPFELVDGEKIPLSPTVAGHNDLTRILLRFLDRHTEANHLGEVYSESPFVLEYSKDWVKGSRTPDVMFFIQSRITAYKANDPDWRTKPFVLVPDLAIEIVSQNDSYSDVEAKAEGYLRDGVRLVWIFDPQRKKIAVHEAGSKTYIVLSEENILTGGEVLPGFEISVAKIFE